jgi:zinc protease
VKPPATLSLRLCLPAVLSASLFGSAPVLAENIDRTVPPAPLAARPFQLPSASEGQLSNGIRVAVVENHEVPLVYITLAFKGGGWTEPSGRPGLASVTAEMLDEGAGGRDAAAFAAAARALGAEIGAQAGSDGTTASLSCLRSTLAPSLDLLQDLVLKPSFPSEPWQRLQARRLQGLESARTDSSAIANRVAQRLLYGDQYRGNLQTEAAYKAMTPADMAVWWQENARPDELLILVGGDTTLAEVQPLLEARFGAWQATGPTRNLTRPTAGPTNPGTKVFLVDQPGATQSVIKVLSRAPAPTDPTFSAFDLANTAWGGTFASRLNLNLREEKGWTYGARASHAWNYAGGNWEAGGGFVREHTGEAISEIFKEIAAIKADKPLSPVELDEARNGKVLTWPLNFELPFHLLGQLDDVWRYQLPSDWIAGWPERMKQVQLDSANQAFSQTINADALWIVVVGDAAAVLPQLEPLGLPIVRLDPDGNPTP